jgi:hypothetical protein
VTRQILACCIVLLAMGGYSEENSRPWNPGGTYDQSVPPPDSVLGFPLASRPARYEEIVRYVQRLAETSPRARVYTMGTTYEQRQQYFLAISSPQNLSRLMQIRQDIERLSDPRVTDAAEAAAIAESTPAIVWIGYGIHGDELSSCDAALQVAYQLAAGTDQETKRVLDNLVVCIDPMQNPDGRERFLSQMQQWAGALPNPDAQSIQHTGLWPHGRGNHYLFDLNRDWYSLVHLETRARVQTISTWNPQVFIDSHEMGAYDTYLFSPPREPINTQVGPLVRKWWPIFSSDQAKAFDRFGWSYYTREWNDEWYPGYSNSWSMHNDAVGILYEQAGVEGSLIKRPDGTTLTYRETVHHHVVSSLANLGTAATHRKELLTGFYDGKRDGMKSKDGFPRTFYLSRGENPSRVDRVVQRLLWHRAEVFAAEGEFSTSGLQACVEGQTVPRTLPKGTYIVPADGPRARVVRVMFDTDPRMTTAFLQEERKSLEKNRESKLYDVTAWAVPMLYGVDAFQSPKAAEVPMTRVSSIAPPSGAVVQPDAAYGFLVDYADDNAVEALAMLLQENLKVRSAKEPVAIGGKSYVRGTLLLRRSENPETIVKSLQAVASATGVTMQGIGTALSVRGPDLGGNDFVLLQPPRIALIGGSEIGGTGFGNLWHLLDYKMKMRTSVLTLQQLASADLRKYNTILLPGGESQALSRVLGKNGIGRLRTWVENGGTLVAIGSAAAFAADTASGLSSVRLRSQVLKDLDLFKRAVDFEEKGKAPVLDSAALWSGKMKVTDTLRTGRSSVEEKELAQYDERGRLFMPRGTILRVDLDPEHWLAFGAGDRVGAMVYTSNAFVSRDPVSTPARFAVAERLRWSGLLWPEARERWARTAYATRESKARGQIVLFADDPNFRGFAEGTARLLLNALLLGPGFGTSVGVEW